MNIDPISSKRLYQSVMGQVISLITSGELITGEKLPPERELAERFAVSRASIREAFRALEIIGLIEVRPGGGTYITDLNINPFLTTLSPLFVRQANREQDLLEFRRLIETEAARIAAEKQLPQSLADLRQAIGEMEQAVESNEPNLGSAADILFHQAIFRCSDNYVLIKAAECVSCLMENSVRLNRAKIIKDAEQARLLLEQHRQILAAIESGRGAEAAQAMLAHLQFAQNSVQLTDRE